MWASSISTAALRKRYKIVEAGGMKIGITSVLGKKEIAEFKNAADLTLLEPDQAIPQVLPELREAKCDQLVLLAHAEPDEAEDLARRFPEFDWVVTAHGAEEPPNEPRRLRAPNAHLIEVGHKGMYVVVVGLYKNGQTPFRYPARAARSSLCRCAGNSRDARRVSAAVGNARAGRVGAQAERRIRPAASSPAARRAPIATWRRPKCTRTRRTSMPPTRS